VPNYRFLIPILKHYTIPASVHSELASLYTVPLRAVNGLSHLTMTSNGQAWEVQKFLNQPITFESNQNGNFESNLEALQVPVTCVLLANEIN